MQIKVYVRLRKSVLDPQGQVIRDAMVRSGYDFVKDVRQNKLFEIEVAETDNLKSKIEEIAQNLLSNPIIEDFEIVL